MKPIHKLGGTICNGCRATISTDHNDDLLCDNCNLLFRDLCMRFDSTYRALKAVQDIRQKEVSRQVENRGRWDDENL